jgi:hypothetical protein
MAKIKVTGSLTAKYKQASAAAAEAAMKAVAPELNGRFQEAIGSRVWEWPNVTIRSNKKPVGSPRNIVDSGALRQSNGFQVAGKIAMFRWSSIYASAIHEGAALQNGGIIQPRPWTSAVLGTEKVSGIEAYDYRKAMFDRWLKHFVNGS